MKLLLITQVVDKKDGVLGFVHGWLIELAKVFDHIHVITLKKGEVDLPQNITVHSLGKEEGISRAKYLWRFFSYSVRLRKEYDGVFVHMNPEYIVLMGILWRLMGMKIVLWYNHTYGTWRTKVAMRLAHVVCHTSAYSFTAGTKKSKIMPTGINTERFSVVGGIERKKNSIFYLGRISGVKDLQTLIDSAYELEKLGVSFTLDICGDALPRDQEYLAAMKERAQVLVLKGVISFPGGIPNTEAPRAYSAHEVFVNLTPEGNFDKTVFEAMGCGTLPFASSRAFENILPPEFRFAERDPKDLAKKIAAVFALTHEEKEKHRHAFRTYVIEHHSLPKLALMIRNLYE